MARSHPDSTSRKRKSTDANNNSKRRKISGDHQKSPKNGVIKSPTDYFQYKLTVLENGIKAILVSTIRPEKEQKCEAVDDKTGELKSILEFNKKHIQFTASTGKEKCSQKISNYNDNTSYRKARRSSKQTKPKDNCDEHPGFQYQYGLGALSVTVGAGSLDNPIDLPGLAHLCEHSVLMETKKSGPGVFNSWLNHIWLNYGSANAFTALDRTTYFFAIPMYNRNGNCSFREATELLADSITDPLLSKDSIEKEINALDCEYQMSSDPAIVFRQFWGIFLSLAKASHPLNTFPIGNQLTLAKPCIAERLREWKEEYYVGNSMTLAIQAPLKLDELEKIVVDNFSKIPSGPKTKGTPRKPVGNENPFNTPDFRKVYQIATSNYLNYMFISWSLPSNLTEEFDVSPLKYIAYVLGSQNNGSLIDYLQKKGWALFLASGHQRLGYCTTFHVYLLLTESGLDNYESVVESIFSYLNLMKSKETDTGLFNELQRSKLDDFHYGRHTWPSRNVLDLDRAIQNGRGKYALTAENIIMKFDPTFVNSTVEKLCPRSANYMLLSRRFKEKDNLVQEKWMGIKFISSSVLEATLVKWTDVQPFLEFRFRQLNNAFLNRDLHCPKDSTKPAYRALVQDPRASIFQFQYGVCKPGHLPQAYCQLYMFSNSAPTVMNTVFLSLWLLILENSIERQFPDSQIFLRHDRSLIYFTASDNPSELSKVVIWSLERFSHFDGEVKELSYVFFRDILLKIFEGHANNTTSLSQDLIRYILDENHHRIETVFNVLKDSGFNDFLDFVRGFKTQMSIFGYVQGDIANDRAEEIAAFITKMPYRRIPGGFQRQPRRGMQIPLGQNCLRLYSPNPEYTMTLVMNHYQIGNRISYEELFATYHVSKILQVVCFKQLRTIEQLTYSVHVHPTFFDGIFGITVHMLVQAQKHTAEKIDARIEECLKTAYNAEFALENLIPLMKKYLRSVKENFAEEIRTFFADYLLPDGKGFRKLSIQIMPNPKTPLVVKGGQPSDLSLKYDTTATSKNDYYMTGIDYFKSDLFAYPSLY